MLVIISGNIYTTDSQHILWFYKIDPFMKNKLFQKRLFNRSIISSESMLNTTPHPHLLLTDMAILPP